MTAKEALEVVENQATHTDRWWTAIFTLKTLAHDARHLLEVLEENHSGWEIAKAKEILARTLRSNDHG